MTVSVSGMVGFGMEVGLILERTGVAGNHTDCPVVTRVSMGIISQTLLIRCLVMAAILSLETSAFWSSLMVVFLTLKFINFLESSLPTLTMSFI